MTKDTVAGGSGGYDDADAWRARLGWAFGLVADDPQVRAAALAHLDEARAATRAALARSNEYWRLTLPLGPEEQYREPAFRKALDAYYETLRHSLPSGLGDDGVRERSITAWPGLPYALLFLEWEARFPQEWTAHAKDWGTKQRLIRRLAVPDHTDDVRAKLTQLVELAVLRAHRCKDREYVRVARAVDGPELRRKLADAALTDRPWARLHAGYVLHLLDRPELPNTRYVWRSWLASPGETCPGGAGRSSWP
ncbi:hypothetical protein [Streptomyces cavernicola]|uniref:DUF4034 domain-containing protein n=1 Tax=Streptomyces cavernicola TaxID=3043613 RepID=A0ABT6S6U3_9ACTN|nr:hypothetical protein [Streptomyces sp. B-S-A6]MDI3403798.1 hypothetical protein [Streptomyces sp. B-S-A6]